MRQFSGLIFILLGILMIGGMVSLHLTGKSEGLSVSIGAGCIAIAFVLVGVNLCQKNKRPRAER